MSSLPHFNKKKVIYNQVMSEHVFAKNPHPKASHKTLNNSIQCFVMGKNVKPVPSTGTASTNANTAHASATKSGHIQVLMKKKNLAS